MITFTLLTPFLIAMIFTHFIGLFSLNIIVFILSGILGVILSSLHLGKKFRAWRSVLNLKRSWLSREIFFYFLFLCSGTLYLFTQNKIFGITAIFLGLFTLISMDKIYSAINKVSNYNLFYSSTVLIAIFFSSILSLNFWFFGLMVLIKVSINIYQIFWQKASTKKSLIFKSIQIIILLSGLMLAIINFPGLILILFIIGGIVEIIGRIEFYNSIEVMTPANEIKRKILNN